TTATGPTAPPAPPQYDPRSGTARALLIESVSHLFRDRDDFFVGGNMCVHYSMQQLRNRDFLGPDFLFVNNVPYRRRPYWAVWMEDGRYPNVIVELLSPTTADADRTTKRRTYEQTFRTPEYFLYDFDAGRFEGWRLDDQGRYQPIAPDER